MAKFTQVSTRMVRSRREFLRDAVRIAALLSAATPTRLFATSQPTHGHPLPHTFYNDDVTHLEYCLSPYRQRGQTFSEDLLIQSIDEAANAGIDAYVIQPGTSWVPWWKSLVYPADEHYRWFSRKYDVPLTGFAQYLMAGGDMIRAAQSHCKKRGLPFYVSIRLNDVHGLEFSGASPDKLRKFYQEQPQYLFTTQLFSRVHADHPEWRFDPRSAKRTERAWNWGHPGVRAHKLQLIEEVCRQYDVDGLELDFMRYPRFFGRRVATSKRTKVMSEFIRRVRAALDQTSISNKRRHLRLRIPSQLGALPRLGVDVSQFREMGVDMVNLSSAYFTSQDVDYSEFRRQIPDIPLYLEMTHVKSRAIKVTTAAYDGATFIRTLAEDFFTTANVAMQQGFSGVSLFNFVYYREHEGENAKYRGPFSEPPFQLIRQLWNREFLASQSRNYFLGTLFHGGLKRRQLEQNLVPNKWTSFRMVVDRFERKIFESVGLLRLQLRGETTSHAEIPALEVRVNDIHLVPSDDLADRITDPYRAFVPGATLLYGWRVPIALLRTGTNRISVQAQASMPLRIQYMEITIPKQRNSGAASAPPYGTVSQRVARGGRVRAAE